MATINYQDIKFDKTQNDNIILDFYGNEIHVASYLPINDKYNLIMITLQKSLDSNIYNQMWLEVYFKLNLIYMYSNIVFSTQDRADELALYDKLTQSGLAEMIIEAIPKDEVEYLRTILEAIEHKITTYNNSFAGFLNNFINQVSDKLQDGMDMLKQIDSEKLQELLNNPQIAALLGKNTNLN